MIKANWTQVIKRKMESFTDKMISGIFIKNLRRQESTLFLLSDKDDQMYFEE